MTPCLYSSSSLIARSHAARHSGWTRVVNGISHRENQREYGSPFSIRSPHQ